MPLPATRCLQPEFGRISFAETGGGRSVFGKRRVYNLYTNNEPSPMPMPSKQNNPVALTTKKIISQEGHIYILYIYIHNIVCVPYIGDATTVKQKQLLNMPRCIVIFISYETQFNCKINLQKPHHLTRTHSILVSAFQPKLKEMLI